MLTLQDLQIADRMRPVQLIALKVKFFGDGLSQGEIGRAEEIASAAFPDDFKLFLSNLEDPAGLFFDWRNVTRASYTTAMNRVLDGVLFDVEHNAFWHPSLGSAPESAQDRTSIVRQAFQAWPKLAPVYKHRFLPIEPLRSGNPVLSIWQTDIIAYGENLIDYLYSEFNLDPRMRPDFSATPTLSIPIWYET